MVTPFAALEKRAYAPYYPGAPFNRPPVQGSPFSQRPQVASDWDRAIPAGQPASLPIPGTAPTETPVALGAQRLPNVDPGDPMSVAGDDWNTPVEMGASPAPTPGAPYYPGAPFNRPPVQGSPFSQRPQVATPGAPPTGPSDEYLTRVMGSYDPNSRLDRRKADAIRQIWASNGGQQVSPNQIYADPRYSQIKRASFAMLGMTEMEKSAFLQRTVDGAWNATAKPMGESIGRMFRGVGNIVGGAARNVWNTSTMPIHTIGSGLAGAWRGGNQGGLGGAIQGAFDGATSAIKTDMGDRWDGTKQLGRGVGQTVGGALETVGRGAFAAPSAAVGAMTGYGTYQDPRMKGYGIHARPKTPPTSNAAPATPPATAPGLQNAQPLSNNAPNYNTFVKSWSAKGPVIDVEAEVLPPFAYLEKQAGPSLARGIQKGLGAAGRFFGRRANVAREAWRAANEPALRDRMFSASQLAHDAGQARMSAPIDAARATYRSRAGKIESGIAARERQALESVPPSAHAQRGVVQQDYAKKKQELLSRAGDRQRAAEDRAWDSGRQYTKDREALVHGRLRDQFENRVAGAGGIAGRLENGIGKLMTHLDDPRISKLINWGGGTALAGAGLYGSNRLGYSSGRSDGYDIGVDAGISSVVDNAPGDPGLLGRIADVFTGPAQGPDAAAIRAMLAQKKDDILGLALNA